MNKQLTCVILVIMMLLCLCPAASAIFTENNFSDNLVAYIKQGEGFSPQAFNDGTGWYIGYGCLINPSDYPSGITEPQADALLRQRMQDFADYVNSFCRKYNVNVTQGQFDAMCGMSYALGPAWLKAGNRLPDYLISGINNYTDQQIASAFAAWCHVGGKVNNVALRRRIMEAKMFLDDDYSFSSDGWNWIILDPNGGTNSLSDVAVYRTGSVYTVLPAVSKTGQYFAGWQTETGTILSPADIVSQNLRLKALWSSTPVDTSLSLPAQVLISEPVSIGETPSSISFFTDVPENEWYTEYVLMLADAGIINGFDDGSFRPQDCVTWAQALKLILLASGYPEQSPIEAEPDGLQSHWASGYLEFAEKKNLLQNTVTEIDGPITRYDLSDLCATALELTETVTPSPFSDTTRGSVLCLYTAGIMEGSIEGGNRLFNGSKVITRAEICAVLSRIMRYVDTHLILFGEYRIPVDESLRKNPYDSDAFTLENGRMQYSDENISAKTGIDVSEYQGSIDWAAVAADGIDFAMIRCGYRGYGSASLNEDSYFRENITGALANGLDVGVYFFSQALTVKEAREEATYVLNLINDYNISFPVVFDWEIVNSYGSRTRYYTRKDVANFTEAFCETISDAGYIPMAYFNPSLAYLRMDLSIVQNYAGWLANYVERTEFRYDFQMWQYGSNGNVAGIKTRCDMDICLTDFSS